MSREVCVSGIAMVPFTKPGANEPYPTMAAKAVRGLLADANIEYKQIQQAYVGYVYGDSTSGQRALYEVGMTGLPVVNVNNNCATGSTALYLARQAVASGAVDCALALGFEQMNPGALGTLFTDRPSPFEWFDAEADALTDNSDIPLALRYFGGAGKAYMREYGVGLDVFAKIRAKASRHAVNNPFAIFRQEITEEQVLESPSIWPGVLTRLMACPPTCGAAAAILCSPDYARRNGLRTNVRIKAQVMTTDRPDSFDAHDMRQLVGVGMAEDASQRVYESSGVDPRDVQLVELHDCFAQNELLMYEALGLCGKGGAPQFITDGDNTYGGRVVTNPSGGLLSKGHPLGATGLAQCYELVQQLRGAAEARQVDGATLALQHNVGLGGACVVTLYERIGGATV